jgi:hypothetical protein
MGSKLYLSPALLANVDNPSAISLFSFFIDVNFRNGAFTTGLYQQGAVGTIPSACFASVSGIGLDR